MDNPIRYNRGLSNENRLDYGFDYENDEVICKYNSYNTWPDYIPNKNDNGEYVAVVNLQKQIDSLIQDWKEYLNSKK